MSIIGVACPGVPVTPIEMAHLDGRLDCSTLTSTTHDRRYAIRDTFDTLKAAQKLEAAGMDRKQAEAVVDVVVSAQGGFATRDGLRGLHSGMATLKWMAGLNLALISIVTLAAVLAHVMT
ncbi:MAG: hypothetical protein OXK82_02645 [Deltaproteobacteria bacterium]|nr:hypothetical protein [Deltaproteobacteria bacterium]